MAYLNNSKCQAVIGGNLLGLGLTHLDLDLDSG